MLTGINGTGWPWGPVPVASKDADVVSHYIVRVIGTIRGERTMDPNFGSRINELVFENKGPAFTALIHREIMLRLQEQLPMVTVLKIDIKYSEEDNKPEEVDVLYEYNGDIGNAKEVLQ